MSFALAPDPAQQCSVLKDPLAMLPCSPILEFRKGQKIYDHDQPTSSVFLVLSGKVKASRITDGGRETVLDIYIADEFFGESAFLQSASRRDVAAALEDTRLMFWTVSDLETLAAERPQLAIAMMQLLIDRSTRFTRRIESLCLDNIPRRLVIALVYFSERFGTRWSDGSVEMMPFTHEFLAQYVGTSREIVTSHMVRLRQQELLRYTRKGITLQKNAIKAWLRGPVHDYEETGVLHRVDGDAAAP